MLQQTIVALLVVVVLALAWVGYELHGLKVSLQPVADSSVVHALVGLGSGM